MPHVADPVDSPALPRLVGRLRPAIERVATIRASVHAKLLAGFLAGAVLLLAMGGLSVAVLGHMADRVQQLNRSEERVDRLRQMQYLITAQSHYRAMALLTHDESNLSNIAQAKAQFLVYLDAVERDSPPSQRALLTRVRAANEHFAASSDRVLAVERQGDDATAMDLHLSEEHPISHEIEGAMAALLQGAVQEMNDARATLESDQRLLTWLVVGFSLASLATALVLGFLLSWSFLLPLRTVHRALARLASGRFDEPVEIANRDEFGVLGRNLDATRRELAQLYGELEAHNDELRGTNTQLLARLRQQVVELARSRGMITEAEERLRREIAEVLHSRVQNRLLLVWYRLEECQVLLPHDPAAAERIIAEIREQVDDIREQDVRELSHRLHPSIIRAGLLPALTTLVEEMPGPAVHLNAAPAVEALDHAAQRGLSESVRLTAYRVVEEALGNVVRHAGASRADVGVSAADGWLRVEVRDDGHGFDPRRRQAGLGLGSIGARVERIGGTWSIDSAEGRGTCVAVRLPCSVDQTQDRFDAQAALGQERDAELVGGSAVGPAV